MDEKSAAGGISPNTKKKNATSVSGSLSSSSSANIPVKVRASNAKRHTRLRIIADLNPFLPLLPDISGIDLKNQEHLFHILYSAGVTASLSLHKWLSVSAGNQLSTRTYSSKSGVSSPCSNTCKDDVCMEQRSPSLPKQMNLTSGQCYIPFGPDDAEALKTLSRSGLLDDAVETLRQIPVVREDLAGLSDAELAAATLITPDIAAAALGAFASATVRRPPTRTVESVMASSQDPGATTGGQDSTDEESLELNYSEEDHDDNGDSLLGLACSAGYTDLAKQLVDIRGNANYTGGKNDCTPLMEACSAGHIEIVKYLLENGADVNAFSATQNTALIYAAAAGHVECVNILLEYSCNVDARNENGHCALMEAASSGCLNVVKALVNAGASSVSMSSQCEFKVGLESPLTLAAYKGHLEIVKYLLEKGGDKERQEELHTALMEASMDGHYEVARLLLDHGAPVNLTSDSFESPLTLAACGGHAKLVELLLDRGAEMEEPNDEGYTPLMEASREGHLDVVRILLNRGAQTNTQTDETGETALTLAACGGFKDVVEQLTRCGADLDLGANTPLMEAAQEGHLETVQFLLAENAKRNGLPVDATTATNETALTYAAENGHMDVCAALIEAGANVDHETEGGRTALMKAAKNGNYGVVQFLIMRGAQVNKVSSNNDATALSSACANGHWEIVRLLLDHGGDPSHVMKDGMTCMIEASRNGHTRVVETLLNWHDVPVSGKSSANSAKSSASSSMQNSRLKKVSTQRRVGASKKATAATQPKVECAEKSVNNGGSGATTGNSTTLPTATATLPNQNHQSTDMTMTGNIASGGVTSGGSTPAIISNNLANYYQQSAAINPDELRGMIAGMAAMAAQSNSQPNDRLFAQIAEKALRGTMGAFASQDLMGSLSDNKVHQQFSEMLKQQFSILAGRQKGALSATLPSNTDMQQPDSDQGGNSSCSASITSSPSPPMVACCETTAAHAAAQQQQSFPGSTPVLPNAKRKNSGTSDASKTSSNMTSSATATTRGVVQAKKIVTAKGTTTTIIDECGGLDGIAAQVNVNSSPSPLPSANNTNVKFPAPPPPVMNANVSREAFGLPSPMALKQTLTRTAELIRSKIAPATTTNTTAPVPVEQPPPIIDENYAPIKTPSTRSRRTLSESAAQDSTDLHDFPSMEAISDGSYIDDESLSEERPLRRTDLPNMGGCSFDVDKQTESNHDTALTLAASGGHDTLVELLIARGADIEHHDKKGFTPLILAATGGHANVVELLLNAGANIEAQSERTKDTALSLACSGGRKEVVDLLIKRGANKEHRNVSDYTPLSLAASGGYVDIIVMLLNAGAEINSRTGSKLGISPLMLAAMNGHAPATKLLLERGSDINAHIETNRNTALTLACFQGRTEVVRLLLEYNANVEHRAKTGLTPLMEAANGGYVDVGELLLRAGADPNTSPVPTSRDTALTIAADKGHHKFVEMLIHAGAQIDAHNKKGCTALWLACHGGHLETVQTLVKHDADVDARDNRRVSPLIIAFRKGHVKVVKYMVRHVQQFPSDQECYRFLGTVSDKDQLGKCHQCMEVIVTAKDRQAAEANRAAESLLEILAKEEEQAKSKKLSKQRQNEKKKAKRRAKKNASAEESEKTKTVTESDDLATANDEHASLEGDEGDVDNEKGERGVDDDTSKTDTNIESEQLERVPSVPSVPLTSGTNVSLSSPCEDSMNHHSVAGAHHQQQFSSHAHAQSSTTARTSLAHSNINNNTNTAKSARHRNRNESGNVKANSGSSSASKLPSSTKQSNASTSETEWMKATSRRKEGTRGGSLKSSSTFAGGSIAGGGAVASANQESNSISNMNAWRHVDVAKRRSSRLSVSSNLIARVIGRAGGNINAIREATGAYIEVEKQSGKKEQHDRQITIKGSETALRQAMEMINGLIVDSECTVSDVIRRVTSSAGNSSASSSLAEELTTSGGGGGSSRLPTTIYSSSSIVTPSNAVACSAQLAVGSKKGSMQQQQQSQSAQQQSCASSTSAPQTAASCPSATTSPTTTALNALSSSDVSSSSLNAPKKNVVPVAATTSATATTPTNAAAAAQTPTNVWAQRAAQRQKLVSAIGSEKKLKAAACSSLQQMATGTTMQQGIGAATAGGGGDIVHLNQLQQQQQQSQQQTTTSKCENNQLAQTAVIDLPVPVLPSADVGTIGERAKKCEKDIMQMKPESIATFSKAPGTRPSPGSTPSSPMSSAGVSPPLSTLTNGGSAATKVMPNLSGPGVIKPPVSVETVNDFSRVLGSSVPPPISGNLGFGDIGGMTPTKKTVAGAGDSSVVSSTLPESAFLTRRVGVTTSTAIDPLAKLWPEYNVMAANASGVSSSATWSNANNPVVGMGVGPSVTSAGGVGLLGASTSHSSLGMLNDHGDLSSAAVRNESLELAHNIAQLRAHAQNAAGSIGEEDLMGSGNVGASSTSATTLRGFSSVQEPSANSRSTSTAAAAAFASEPPFAWRTEPPSTAGMQRPSQTLAQSVFPDRDNTWINQVAMQLAVNQPDVSCSREFSTGPFSQLPTPIGYPSSNQSAYHKDHHHQQMINAAGLNHQAQTQQSQHQQQQPYNRVHLQQASQAASNEFENLSMLLNSFNMNVRPPHTGSTASTSNNPRLDTTTDFAASAPNVPPYHSTRTAALNTSIPPPPFFSTQVPPPPSTATQPNNPPPPPVGGSPFFGGWPLPPNYGPPTQNTAVSHGTTMSTTLNDSALLSHATANRSQWNGYAWQ